MQDVYKNIEEYNLGNKCIERKVSIVIGDIVDNMNNH